MLTKDKIINHKLINSIVINNNKIFYYHNLKLLDSIYNKNIYEIKIFLEDNFKDIKFIYNNINYFDFKLILPSLDKIYIIYNNLELITHIIGIDIRPKYSYNLN